ncbi:MAG: cation:proton antiporter [Thermodesulfobacteriota bacterium]
MENIPFLLLAGFILCVFFLVSFTSEKLRMPSVLIYIILGLAVSSYFVDSHAIHTVAEIGIVLLFFILGLEFPMARMLDISKRVWPAGFMDVALNLVGAMLIGLLFGLDFISAFILGSVAYATSSSISAKMLEEKKRLANPEAEFILALLIFEDLVAPILVSFIASIQGGQEITAPFMLLLLAKILFLLLGAIIIGHFGFKKLNQFVAKHIQKDFMPLLAVGIALGYAGVAIQLGLSEVLGAFLAGVMLSETGRASELEHLLVPIRHLTLPFFFFWFGTSIDLGQGVPFLGMLLVLLIWALLGKSCTAYWGGRLFGLTRKVSCRAAFSMVQRGEFSAIIASLAAPQLRIFSGIYILITAIIGVLLFNKAPAIANWYHDKWCKKCALEEAEAK